MIENIFKNGDLIDQLEILLSRAKAGEINCLVGITTTTGADRYIENIKAGDAEKYECLGFLKELELSILNDED